MSDTTLGRLRHCLIDALERSGHGAGRPLKVATIYQDLVPYAAVRSEIGVELNADYEHALLRLLAGEGGMLRVEQPEAREALRKEVAEPYPFVGIYRKFAGCDVTIQTLERPAPEEAAPPDAPSAAEPPAAAGPPPQRGDRDPGAPPDWLLDRQEAGAVRPAVPEPSAGEAAAGPGTEAGPEAAEREMPERCPRCQAALPAGRTVLFCPRCGADQRSPTCLECSEPVDPDWRFCIACGAGLGGGSPGDERSDGPAP